MAANIVTISVILLILAGVTTYAVKRVRRVLRETQAREATRAAALMAEVMDEATGEPQAAAHPDAHKRTPSPVSESRSNADQPEPVEMPVEPVTVEAEMRAFFGQAPPAVEQTTASPASGEVASVEGSSEEDTEPPQAVGAAGLDLARNARFDAAAAHVALALREAADEVEETATSQGPVAERAARTVAVVTKALGSLSLEDLISAAHHTPSD